MRLRRNQMKQYEDGYNVNGYSWENETIEYLLNDKQLTDNHIPEWVKKMKLQHSGSG